MALRLRGYIATTDFSWFSFLRARQPLDEANFWQPSAHGFNSPPGTPFFFKLKSPHNAIGGFGIFARYEAASVSLAWEAFGARNGAASLEEMRRRVQGYATRHGEPGHRIGCIMVANPVFFDDPDWIPQPSDWARNIVSGAGYELEVGEGRRIWERCQELAAPRVTALPLVAQGAVVALPSSAQTQKYGAPMLVQPRLGQGTFRVAVTAAYGGACAVCGEHSLPVLEAAHIKPYSDEEGVHSVANGLLLRADIHRLFDRGYVTVTPDARFLVSERLKQEFENGRAYYKRNGKPVSFPARPEDRPDPELLRWHNEHVFEERAA